MNPAAATVGALATMLAAALAPASLVVALNEPAGDDPDLYGITCDVGHALATDQCEFGQCIVWPDTNCIFVNLWLDHGACTTDEAGAKTCEYTAHMVARARSWTIPGSLQATASGLCEAEAEVVWSVDGGRVAWPCPGMLTAPFHECRYGEFRLDAEADALLVPKPVAVQANVRVCAW